MFIFLINSGKKSAVKEVIEMMRMVNVLPRYDVAFRPRTRVLNRFFSDWVLPSTYVDESDWTPASNIAETDTEYHVTMELPGIVRRIINLKIIFLITLKNMANIVPVIQENCLNSYHQ
jgi:hypothetical protein